MAPPRERPRGGARVWAPACARAWGAAPDAPWVVWQFRSPTEPVIVISFPAAAAWPCAASGSAHRPSTAVVARVRFNIGSFSSSRGGVDVGDSVYHTFRPRGSDWRILGAMSAAYRELPERVGAGGERGGVAAS